MQTIHYNPYRIAAVRHGAVLIALTLACFALSPRGLAQLPSPTPDGGYLNHNTAEGSGALFNLTSGGNNTALGYRALFKNTVGNDNTATGYLALRTNKSGGANTANGNFSLLNNTSGGDNTAIGLSALVSNTTGGNNTATGVGALRTNTSGNNNIALGWEAGLNLTTGNNNIEIGNLGVAGESNTIRIGGDVGTGYGAQTATFIAGIRGTTTANADAVPVVIDSAGQLGTVSSAARFKKDIGPMDEASEAILSLRPVVFHYKNDTKGMPQFGLIAEEVAKVNPDLIVRDGKGEIYTVRYDAVNAMLLNEFLKEHRRVQELESQVEKLTVGLQKVNDELELKKTALQTVDNNQ